MITAGIDAGSRAIKIVLIDTKDLRIVASGLSDQGVKQAELASQLFDRVLTEAGIARTEIGGIVATGYGRDAIDAADTTITEITCHARGVHHLNPEARTVIDIGGQDSKLLRLADDGKVRDFAMNDRCAAGTGRFLEVVAERLDLELDALGEMARNADAPATVSSMCVVFAETEIVSLLASGESAPNIVAGVQASIASRVSAMAGRHVVEPVVFTGGVALIPGMAAALEGALHRPIETARIPRMTGALGAAILAADGAG